MMLIDLNDETMWQTENGGAEYFTEVPFSHPGLPPGDLTVQINCEEAAFSPSARAYAQHCLDNLHGRIDDMIARLLARIGHNNRSVFSIERGAKSLVLFAGDTRTSILGVLHADTRASVCAEWDGDEIIRIWGQDEGSTEPAWQVSEGLRGQPKHREAPSSEQPQAGRNGMPEMKPEKKGYVPDQTELKKLNKEIADLQKRGRHDRAIPLAQKALQIVERSPEPDKSGLALCLNNLASLHYAQGQFIQAEPYYRRSLALIEETRGPDHILVSALQNNLAGLYFDMAQYALAEPLYKRSLEIREKNLSPFHPDVLQSLDCLAAVYRQTGRIPDAMAMEQRAAALRAIKR